MKDSGIEWLGEVPAHWDVSRLKFVAHVQTGVAKGKDNSGRQTVEVPYLRVANVQDGFLDLDEVSSIEIPLADLPRYRLQAGDVLMNEGGDFDKLGRGHVWDGSIDPCIHQNHVFAVRPFGISASWLNAVTGSAPAQFYFMSRSKQSTNLASISSTNIMELPVVIPPADEQESILRSITTRSAAFNELIEDARASVRLLRERRIAVISAAVTGQIDVRDRTTLDSALAETRADIAASRYVVESAAAHVARAPAMARVDEQAPSPPSSC
jgi:type I restriction enzyme S subunit